MKNYLILVLLLIVNCGKDSNEGYTYPRTMTFDKIEVKSNLTVYGGGVILNEGSQQKTISDFLRRNYTIGSISYNSAFREPDSDSETKYFTLFEDGSIDYSIPIIERKEENGVHILISSIENELKDDAIVSTDLFKYKYRINRNYYNYQYVTHIHEKSIEVSLISFKIVRYNNNILTSIEFGIYHNEFNPEFINTLKQNDTLAVKEYILTYSEK